MRFRNRRLYEHNSCVTLMRTTGDERTALGAELARKVAKVTGPATVFLPLCGVSAIAVQEGRSSTTGRTPACSRPCGPGSPAPVSGAAMVEALRASIREGERDRLDGKDSRDLRPRGRGRTGHHGRPSGLRTRRQRSRRRSGTLAA
ncbi:hypothetical protein [Pseudonocardia adelaidensis]|uniref:hypothetical protein n=1 Tax=Pseudonocardia adelaidensis TaxID=648754 RepID=UPI003CD0BB21